MSTTVETPSFSHTLGVWGDVMVAQALFGAKEMNAQSNLYAIGQDHLEDMAKEAVELAPYVNAMQWVQAGLVGASLIAAGAVAAASAPGTLISKMVLTLVNAAKVVKSVVTGGGALVQGIMTFYVDAKQGRMMQDDSLSKAVGSAAEKLGKGTIAMMKSQANVGEALATAITNNAQAARV